jgi:hypothetical protein
MSKPPLPKSRSEADHLSVKSDNYRPLSTAIELPKQHEYQVPTAQGSHRWAVASGGFQSHPLEYLLLVAVALLLLPVSPLATLGLAGVLVSNKLQRLTSKYFSGGRLASPERSYLIAAYLCTVLALFGLLTSLGAFLPARKGKKGVSFWLYLLSLSAVVCVKSNWLKACKFYLQ